MAISWGSWVTNGSGNGVRLGAEFTQSPSSVGSGTSSVTVTVKLYVETMASVSDSTNSFSWSGFFGSGSTSVSISHGGGGGTTLVRTMSRTVSTSYTSTVTSSVSASLNGINAIPGTASVSDSHSTGKRPYTAPAAPSSVSLSLSGDHGVVRWTRRPTTGAPYDSIELDWQINGGAWQDSATLSGSASSFTTSTFVKNSVYRYRVRAKNSAGVSAWAYSNTVTTPPNPPAAPSNANVARSSDTRQVVTWTRGSSTSTAPITQQEIRRWDYVRGTYITIATVSGSATSFTDSTTVPNQQYRYAVRSKNSAGSSAWTYSDYMSTTPNAPTNVKAVKQGEDIKLTWVNTSGTRITGIEVWLTEAGVDGSSRYWFLSGSATSFTHVSPDPTKTWQYRLKTQSGADANDSAPNLYSAFSARSNVVQLIAPPAAPTNLVPSATAVDADEDQTFLWQHNPIDTTDQTAYEMQYRVDAGAWVNTGKVLSASQSIAFAAGTFTNGTTVEWQVRTWGAHVDPSPWAAIAVVTMSARPSATIVEPDGSMGTPTVISTMLTVAWDYFDPETTTQTSVRLGLDDANGTRVWASTLTMAATTYSIPYTLADGAAYTVTVSVRDAAGLWSYEAAQPFTVTYAKPPAPIVDAVWDLDLGGVVVSIEHPAPGDGEVEAVSSDLRHSADGEEWTTISAGLDPTTSTVDFIPVLDTVNYYQVVSYSGLPSSLESTPVSVMVTSKGWVFVNGGPDWSIICRIRDNVAPSHTPKRARTLNHFAGRPYPIMTSGEARERTVTLSGRTSGGGSADAEWQALYDLGDPVCYREPGPAYGGSGERFSAAFQDYSRSRSRVFEDVQLTFQRVEEV